jgi:hypothetical protein
LFGNRWLPQKEVCGLRRKLRRSSAAVATSRESRAELMLYLERAASALDVLSISGDADMPFAIDVGCE